MTQGGRARLLPVLVTVALVTGCGGGDESDTRGSLGEPLSYLPKTAPLVAAFDTDTTGDQYRNLDKLLGRFPFGGQVKSQLRRSLSESGTDYDKDIRPLLGSQLVIGSPDAKSLTDDVGSDSYVVAFQARDGEKLRAALDKDGTQKKSGKIDGDDVWQSDDGSVATVKDDTLVAAGDRPGLEAALERHDGGDKLTEDEFDAPFAGLPADPILRVYGDAQALLEADPQTATARQVKWVGGLRKFGATVNVEDDGLAVDAKLVTEGVGAQDLPIAAGDRSPALARFGDYSGAQRDLAQSVTFVQATLNAVDPLRGKELQARKAAAAKDLGIDVDRDLVEQFRGDTTVAGGLDGSWSARSQVKDPAAMKKTLDAMVEKGGTGRLKFAEAGGLVLAVDDNGQRAYFGMVDDVFVAGPTPDAARQIASIAAKPVAGARGAQVFVADGEAIAKAILKRTGQGGAAGLFAGPIGELTAYVTAAPSGLRAHAKLKVE